MAESPMSMLLDILGWMGTAAFVVAYYFVSCGRLKTDSFLYQIMNLGGSIAVGLSVYPKKAWPAFWLEIIWGAIAVTALIRICKMSCMKNGRK